MIYRLPLVSHEYAFYSLRICLIVVIGHVSHLNPFSNQFILQQNAILSFPINFVNSPESCLFVSAPASKPSPPTRRCILYRSSRDTQGTGTPYRTVWYFRDTSESVRCCILSLFYNPHADFVVQRCHKTASFAARKD